MLSSNPRAAAEAFIALHPTWRAVPPLAARPQVWYCTIKGYKPWQQPDAKNTKTNEEGGQTIWYDEAQLLQVRGRPDSGALACQSWSEGSRLPRPSLACQRTFCGRRSSRGRGRLQGGPAAARWLPA